MYDENDGRRAAHSRPVVRGSAPPVRGTGLDQRNLGAIGVFGSTLSLVNRRRGRQKGGYPNDLPHAGV